MYINLWSYGNSCFQYTWSPPVLIRAWLHFESSTPLRKFSFSWGKTWFFLWFHPPRSSQTFLFLFINIFSNFIYLFLIIAVIIIYRRASAIPLKGQSRWILTHIKTSTSFSYLQDFCKPRSSCVVIETNCFIQGFDLGTLQTFILEKSLVRIFTSMVLSNAAYVHKFMVLPLFPTHLITSRTNTGLTNIWKQYPFEENFIFLGENLIFPLVPPRLSQTFIFYLLLMFQILSYLFIYFWFLLLPVLLFTGAQARCPRKGSPASFWHSLSYPLQ